ncbi:actin-3-like [Mya arenaria]|uniref:actin-3-like n=1 Tax=Mya arenaria TaxID=6604 RepID=UPI0022E6137F|nr:actin-3-like [Mya arenaria]XP_052784462.1 actin-3-like [Mya arenaria]
MSAAVDDDDVCSLVVDSGSDVTRAGFSGDDAPKAVFPTIIGSPKLDVAMSSPQDRSHYMGESAMAHCGIFSLRRPIQRGVVTDWDDMERIWNHTFYDQLRVDPAEHNVLLTERPLNPRSNREKMLELMFEKYRAPGVYVSPQATLSLYSSGRHGAIIVDIGEGVTHVTAHMGVYQWTQATVRSHLAGSDITEYFRKMLMERGYYFQTSAERDIVRQMKEKLCYVAEDYQAEMSTAATSVTVDASYQLPDGKSVTIGNERFRCAEVLFNPSLIDVEQPSISELVYNTIWKTDIHCRAELCCNVFLAGGSTMFPGFPERLQKELSSLVPPSTKVKVIAAPERKNSVWIGGSILTSLSTFAQQWVTKAQYDEEGPTIVHQKCI